jgi:L-alanine-DL-glutamate epimerase-like enolase superfamily enzyme
MSVLARIATVEAATVDLPLPSPLRFGPYTISSREYAIAVVTADNGARGTAFGLTRNGPVATIVERMIAPAYAGVAIEGDRAPDLDLALSRGPAVLSSGVGYRAVSVVDLAVWDLVGRLAGRSVTELLGGAPRRRPAVAIVGFPPTQTGTEVHDEISALVEQGWRRFKLPMGPGLDATRERLTAAIDAAGPDGSVMFDAAWSWRSVEEAAAFVRELDLPLGWIEDPFVPRDAAQVRALRDAIDLPVASGDDQGGAYYPEALLQAGAADVVRVDATCMGGASRFADLLCAIDAGGARPSPHIFGHVHCRLLDGLGRDEPVEWGIRGNGVCPLSDMLDQPRIVDGLSEPLSADAGFGIELDWRWLAGHDLDDPSGLSNRSAP